MIDVESKRAALNHCVFLPVAQTIAAQFAEDVSERRFLRACRFATQQIEEVIPADCLLLPIGSLRPGRRGNGDIQ
ncbi:hypothetical protein FJV46_15055 [Arthrobacter agilis]|uniref:hypothetical protein n=1 Tax=Arthrobacter agilis TaxID=37921 RepID=UPI0011298B7C|nr:hypothetical protein [Arthrobacter agilis]TPV21034.1 hypothetical protein FJV46_15055 [Arthrobacter agilis]